MCDNCKIKLNEEICPLCFKQVKKIKINKSEYPTYNEIRKRKKIISTIVSIILFLIFFISVITSVVNYITYKKTPIMWAEIVIGAMLSIFIILIKLFDKKKHIGNKILTSFVIISLLLIIIDNVTGASRWSTNFVIPILGLLSTLTMILIGAIKKSLWESDIGYFFIIVLLNIIPLLLYIFKLSIVLWPSLLSIIFSAILILLLLIFNNKDFISEIKKRFHIK